MSLDAFLEYLSAEIPREMPLDGKVDVRVARALAWYIAEKGDAGKAILDLQTYAVWFDAIIAGAGDGDRTAAEFVRDALAFVADDQHQRRVLARCLDGASAEEAVKESAA